MTVEVPCPICGGMIEVELAIFRSEGGWCPTAEHVLLPCHRLSDAQTDALMDAAEDAALDRIEREGYPVGE
jgi:hypothetical protein